MANMSYCRFENTNNDLADCVEFLQDGELPESDTERRALRNMIELAREIAEMADDWIDDELADQD